LNNKAQADARLGFSGVFAALFSLAKNFAEDIIKNFGM